MSETDKIHAAIIAAMKKTHGLQHDGRNDQGRYNFTSVDAFLAMTRKACAECGLFFNMVESNIENVEKKGQNGITQWMRIAYDVTLHHESGQSLALGERTVEVLRNGPQAFMSAESFVLKRVQRVLFQIPTGDKIDPELSGDADDEYDEAMVAADTKSLVGLIEDAATLSDLQSVWLNFPNAKAKASKDAVAAKDKRKAELSK